MTDFEKAALNAIMKTFKKSYIQGCYFHFASNLWKHVKSNGLSTFYCAKENIHFRNNFKWLKALAFIPSKCVLIAFKKLKETAEFEFESILAYYLLKYRK